METFTRAMETFTSAKETFTAAMETFAAAMETLTSAMETFTSAMETFTAAMETFPFAEDVFRAVMEIPTVAEGGFRLAVVTAAATRESGTDYLSFVIGHFSFVIDEGVSSPKGCERVPVVADHRMQDGSHPGRVPDLFVTLGHPFTVRSLISFATRGGAPRRRLPWLPCFTASR